MEMGGGVFEVQSTSGDTKLGGTDMDQLLMDYVKEEFIGGCDIVKEMFEKGELQKILNVKC